jgi:hypothetical protein
MITEIVSSQREDGSTLIRLSADAPFAHRLFRHEPPAGDPPQHRLYLPGISIPDLPREVLRVDGPNLVGVELLTETIQEQAESQIVLHLDSPEVTITRLASKATHLVIQLGTQAAWPSTPVPEAGRAQAQVAAEPVPTKPAVDTAQVPAELVEEPVVEVSPTATGAVISDIQVVRQSDGATVLRLIADGPISGDRFRSFEVSSDPPRHGLSIDGVSMPGAPELIPVNGPCLDQIRVVQPQTGEPLALHLILELAAGEVEVAYATHIDNLVLLRLLPPPSPSTSAPTPRATANLIVEPAEIADTIVDVTFWRRSDGATVLLVTANGPIPEESFLHEPTRGTPPVAILRVGGITKPYYPEQIPVNDANIHQVRVGHFGDELILAIEVTSANVGITQVVHQETKLLVHLER